MENSIVKFNKGGGGSYVASDNLFSDDTVELLIGIGEGEIEGLVDGAKNFYLDDTPLVNSNGTNNFENFELNIHPGSGIGEEIKFALTGSSRSSSVGVALAQNTPVTRVTQAANIDYIELRLVIASLYKTHTGKKGSDTTGASITLKIEYKYSSDSEWINVFPNNLIISGKTTTQFFKEVRWPVQNREEGRYDIRVTKLSQDSYQNSSDTYSAAISFESIQEINSSINSFPHTALAHIVAQSTDQFSSIPEFSGLYKLLKV